MKNLFFKKIKKYILLKDIFNIAKVYKLKIIIKKFLELII